MITALRDARVGTRLATAFGLIGLLLVGGVGVGLWGNAVQASSAKAIRSDVMVPLRQRSLPQSVAADPPHP